LEHGVDIVDVVKREIGGTSRVVAERAWNGRFLGDSRKVGASSWATACNGLQWLAIHPEPRKAALSSDGSCVDPTQVGKVRVT